jgi:hypothetical protein
LRLELGELLEVAGISHNRGVLFEGIELVHDVIIQFCKKSSGFTLQSDLCLHSRLKKFSFSVAAALSAAMCARD